MWKLKCVNNNEVVEKETIKFTNVIGRDNVRLFFARNGMPMSDVQREVVFEIMESGQKIKYMFPNNKKYIEVEKITL